MSLSVEYLTGLMEVRIENNRMIAGITVYLQIGELHFSRMSTDLYEQETDLQLEEYLGEVITVAKDAFARDLLEKMYGDAWEYYYYTPMSSSQVGYMREPFWTTDLFSGGTYGV